MGPMQEFPTVVIVLGCTYVICMFHPRVLGAFGSQERVMGPMQLGLRMVCEPPCLLGTEHRFHARAASSHV